MRVHLSDQELLDTLVVPGRIVEREYVAGVLVRVLIESMSVLGGTYQRWIQVPYWEADDDRNDTSGQ